MSRDWTPQISDEQLRDALTRRPDAQRMAADLAVIVATVERTHQRRWLPAGLLSGAARMRSAAVLLAVLGLLVALAIALAIAVGSRHRLPAPFGLAKPGLIAVDVGGAIYVENPDGTGRTQLTSGFRDDHVMWSPDGTLLAYETQLEDLSSGVVVVSADGGQRVTVMGGLAQPGNIVWSPDSRRIAFGARLMTEQDFHVYIAEVDRIGAIQLGGPDLYGTEPSWSPDGTKIAFKRMYPCCGAPAAALWLIDTDGSNLHQLSSRTGSGDSLWNTVWSPDGKQLAFLADGVGLSRDVYVINADGTGERNISNSPEDEYWPSWSPDGTRVAFPRMSLTVHNQGTFIVVDPDGSNPVVLTGPPINSNTAVWSPDGTRLLGYAKNPDPSIDQNVGIAVFDPTGRAPPTTIPEGNFGNVSWQRLAP